MFLKEFLNNLQVYKNIRAQNKYFVKGYFIENFVENLELELEKLCKFIWEDGVEKFEKKTI